MFSYFAGIRGEISLKVRVDLSPDVYKLKLSSLGVRFFFCEHFALIYFDDFGFLNHFLQ